MATPPPITISDGLKKLTTLASIEPIAATGGLEHRDGHRIAERGGPGDVLRGDGAALVERGRQARAAAVAGRRLARPAQRLAAGEGLEAADVAAAADDGGVVDDLDVTDVAGAALGAAMQAAVGDDPGPDPGPDLDDDDVVVADRDARTATRRGPGG